MKKIVWILTFVTGITYLGFSVEVVAKKIASSKVAIIKAQIQIDNGEFFEAITYLGNLY